MKIVKKFKHDILIPLLFIGTLFSGCSEDKKDLDPVPDANVISGTVTVNNIGARAYLFTAVSGSGITTDLNVENAGLTLKIGNRYRFINMAGLGHPFQILGNGNTILLSQNEIEGTLEKDIQIKYQVEGDNITFTLTQNLANQIAPYVCGNHAAMSGNINAIM